LAPQLRLLAAPALVAGGAPPITLPPNDALMLAMLALDGVDEATRPMAGTLLAQLAARLRQDDRP